MATSALFSANFVKKFGWNRTAIASAVLVLVSSLIASFSLTNFYVYCATRVFLGIAIGTIMITVPVIIAMACGTRIDLRSTIVPVFNLSYALGLNACLLSGEKEYALELTLVGAILPIFFIMIAMKLPDVESLESKETNTNNPQLANEDVSNENDPILASRHGVISRGVQNQTPNTSLTTIQRDFERKKDFKSSASIIEFLTTENRNTIACIVFLSFMYQFGHITPTFTFTIELQQMAGIPGYSFPPF